MTITDEREETQRRPQRLLGGPRRSLKRYQRLLEEAGWALEEAGMIGPFEDGRVKYFR